MTRSALRRGLVLVLGLGLLCAQPAGAASPGSPTAALEIFFERANAIMRTVEPMRGLDEPRQAVRELVNDVPLLYVAERPGDLGTVHVSGERAARELGWRARTPFREGLKRYIEWASETNGSPSSSMASITDGSAATVVRQEPAAL